MKYLLVALLFVTFIACAEDPPVYTVERTDDPVVTIIDRPAKGAIKKNWVFR